MDDDPKIDEFKHAIEVLDVLHGGYALDGMSVSLMLSLKGGHSVPMVISAAAAEKMILGIQLALTKNAEKRTGVLGKVFGEFLSRVRLWQERHRTEVTRFWSLKHHPARMQIFGWSRASCEECDRNWNKSKNSFVG